MGILWAGAGAKHIYLEPQGKDNPLSIYDEHSAGRVLYTETFRLLPYPLSPIPDFMVVGPCFGLTGSPQGPTGIVPAFGEDQSTACRGNWPPVASQAPKTYSGATYSLLGPTAPFEEH